MLNPKQTAAEIPLYYAYDKTYSDGGSKYWDTVTRRSSVDQPGVHRYSSSSCDDLSGTTTLVTPSGRIVSPHMKKKLQERGKQRMKIQEDLNRKKINEIKERRTQLRTSMERTRTGHRPSSAPVSPTKVLRPVSAESDWSASVRSRRAQSAGGRHSGRPKSAMRDWSMQRDHRASSEERLFMYHPESTVPTASPTRGVSRHASRNQYQPRTTRATFKTFLTMQYRGLDPTATITPEFKIVQHRPGSCDLTVFDGALHHQEVFSLILSRGLNDPFGLTIFKSGLVHEQFSACCEHKYPLGTQLGGRSGSFSIVSVTGSTPCFDCAALAQRAKDEKSRRHSMPAMASTKPITPKNNHTNTTNTNTNTNTHHYLHSHTNTLSHSHTNTNTNRRQQQPRSRPVSVSLDDLHDLGTTDDDERVQGSKRGSERKSERGSGRMPKRNVRPPNGIRSRNVSVSVSDSDTDTNHPRNPRHHNLNDDHADNVESNKASSTESPPRSPKNKVHKTNKTNSQRPMSAPSDARPREDFGSLWTRLFNEDLAKRTRLLTEPIMEEEKPNTILQACAGIVSEENDPIHIEQQNAKLAEDIWNAAQEQSRQRKLRSAFDRARRSAEGKRESDGDKMSDSMSLYSIETTTPPQADSDDDDSSANSTDVASGDEREDYNNDNSAHTPTNKIKVDDDIDDTNNTNNTNDVFANNLVSTKGKMQTFTIKTENDDVPMSLDGRVQVHMDNFTPRDVAVDTSPTHHEHQPSAYTRRSNLMNTRITEEDLDNSLRYVSENATTNDSENGDMTEHPSSPLVNTNTTANTHASTDTNTNANTKTNANAHHPELAVSPDEWEGVGDTLMDSLTSSGFSSHADKMADSSPILSQMLAKLRADVENRVNEQLELARRVDGDDTNTARSTPSLSPSPQPSFSLDMKNVKHGALSSSPRASPQLSKSPVSPNRTMSFQPAMRRIVQAHEQGQQDQQDQEQLRQEEEVQDQEEQQERQHQHQKQQEEEGDDDEEEAQERKQEQLEEQTPKEQHTVDEVHEQQQQHHYQQHHHHHDQHVEPNYDHGNVNAHLQQLLEQEHVVRAAQTRGSLDLNAFDSDSDSDSDSDEEPPSLNPI